MFRPKWKRNGGQGSKKLMEQNYITRCDVFGWFVGVGVLEHIISFSGGYGKLVILDDLRILN